MRDNRCAQLFVEIVSEDVEKKHIEENVADIFVEKLIGDELIEAEMRDREGNGTREREGRRGRREFPLAMCMARRKQTTLARISA